MNPVLLKVNKKDKKGLVASTEALDAWPIERAREMKELGRQPKGFADKHLKIKGNTFVRIWSCYL